MKKLKEKLSQPENGVPIFLVGVASVAMLLNVVIPDEKSYSIVDSQPAKITEIQEDTIIVDDFYIGATNMSRRIFPFVEIYQCDLIETDFCTTERISLPTEYETGSLALGQTFTPQSLFTEKE